MQYIEQMIVFMSWPVKIIARLLANACLEHTVIDLHYSSEKKIQSLMRYL